MRILKKPLERGEAERIASKDPAGFIRGVVPITLGSIIRGDMESFLDMLSMKLTGNELLQDIHYRIVGHQEPETLLIEVEGDPSAAYYPGFGPREWIPKSSE